jgi:hypothetical protein
VTHSQNKSANACQGEEKKRNGTWIDAITNNTHTHIHTTHTETCREREEEEEEEEEEVEEEEMEEEEMEEEEKEENTHVGHIYINTNEQIT